MESTAPAEPSWLRRSADYDADVDAIGALHGPSGWLRRRFRGAAASRVVCSRTAGGIAMTAQQRIFLATEPVDMRGGFDRLAGRVLSAGLDLYGGDLFVFVSRRRKHLKVLTWDKTGLVVTYKRLGRGRFTLPVPSGPARTVTLDTAQLVALISGSPTC